MQTNYTKDHVQRKRVHGYDDIFNSPIYDITNHNSSVAKCSVLKSKKKYSQYFPKFPNVIWQVYSKWLAHTLQMYRFVCWMVCTNTFKQCLSTDTHKHTHSAQMIPPEVYSHPECTCFSDVLCVVRKVVHCSYL